jgi:hypothetical protein
MKSNDRTLRNDRLCDENHVNAADHEKRALEHTCLYISSVKYHMYNLRIVRRRFII